MSKIIRFYELGIKSELGMFLVEYGFPNDTIKTLEDKNTDILGMDAKEAAGYFITNPHKLRSVLDEYESGLYERAVNVLLKR